MHDELNAADKYKPAMIDDAANQPTKVAVIGCGGWGRNLVRTFHRLGALQAVSDIDADRANSAATEFGVPHTRGEELFRAADIHAIAIATPAESHAQVAIQALRAGKHVFVEKPMALTVEEARAIAAEAEKARRLVMVGHLLQYHPAYLALRKAVDEGQLGRIQYIYSNRLNFGKIRRKENVFWSFAPHDISMILGLAKEMPSAVHAHGAYYLHGQLADVTTTHLEFPSGINAHIFVSWLHPMKEQRLIVVGEQSMAVFDDQKPWSSKLMLYPHRVAWQNGEPMLKSAEGQPVPLVEEEPLMRECLHFLECVRYGKMPRTDAYEGIRVLEVLTRSESALKRAPREQSHRQVGPAQIHETAIVDEGCSIGSGTKIWHFSHILSGSNIGRNCVIGQNVMIGPDVIVGDGCKIQNNVSLYKGVKLGNAVFVGPSAVFTNVNTPRADIERKSEFLETIVEDGATIGANATIVCGHRLGARSFVAAGSVVTRDVPPHALVAGVPARRIGWVSHTGERLDNSLTCPRSGRRYQLTPSGGLVEITEKGQE
jgi:UDP-2-acetamido-3-amino-2,3-dideoxy-glucuronate N-acetyltransferase